MLLLLYNLKERYDSFIFNFKNSLFENYYSRLGYYDKETLTFEWIYDYDNFTGYIWIFILTLFNTPDLFSYDYQFDSNKIYVGTCYHDKQVHSKIICSKTEGEGRNIDHKNLVYFVIDEKYDLTQEYKAFKTSLINLKEIDIIDVVYILSYFNNKEIKLKDNSIIKILADDHHFEELFYDLKTN